MHFDCQSCVAACGLLRCGVEVTKTGSIFAFIQSGHLVMLWAVHVKFEELFMFINDSVEISQASSLRKGGEVKAAVYICTNS